MTIEGRVCMCVCVWCVYERDSKRREASESLSSGDEIMLIVFYDFACKVSLASKYFLFVFMLIMLPSLIIGVS